MGQKEAQLPTSARLSDWDQTSGLDAESKWDTMHVDHCLPYRYRQFIKRKCLPFFYLQTIKATFSYYLFFSAQRGEAESSKAAELQVCVSPRHGAGEIPLYSAHFLKCAFPETSAQRQPLTTTFQRATRKHLPGPCCWRKKDISKDIALANSSHV